MNEVEYLLQRFATRMSGCPGAVCVLRCRIGFMIRHLILLAIVGFLLCACQRVVGTGRSQLNILSHSQEQSLGQEAFETAIADATIVRAGSDADMVQRVGERILRSARRLYPSNPADRYDWTFVLIEDDRINAWAAPGGKVAIYTGLLDVTRDEDGLAVVMGHEVAHVLARHSAEQVSQALLMEGAITAGTSALGDMEPATRETVMRAMGVGAQYGVALPFSRLHEAEADEIGLFLPAGACYAPRAAIGVWERMASSGGSRPPEFLSTHPDPYSRLDALRQLMPGAMAIYEQCGQRRR